MGMTPVPVISCGLLPSLAISKISGLVFDFLFERWQRDDRGKPKKGRDRLLWLRIERCRISRRLARD